MFSTLEVRWFHNGTPPSSVQNWLSHLHPAPPRTWTDVYLPCTDTGLNLKVREDKLQIKRRTEGPTVHTFKPNVTGRCEKWVKWSFDLADESADPRDRDVETLWVPVEKTRQQCTFDANDPGPAAPALPPDSDASVFVELTTLHTTDVEAWTLCVEAEGPTESLAKTFSTASRELFDDTFPLTLTEDASYGYVHWLTELPGVDTESIEDVNLPATA